MTGLSREQAQTITKALRAGTVPNEGLEHYAVGLDRELSAFCNQMDYVEKGHADFKFVRGDFGAGKTFLTSLVAAEALKRNFVVSKVVISSTDTPLYKFDEVYRKICQKMVLSGNRPNALGNILDRWFYSLEEQVGDIDKIDEEDPGYHDAIDRRVDNHLHSLADKSGRFAACIKAYHRLQFEGDYLNSRGILDWMCGDAKVAASAKKQAKIKGDLKRSDVFTFLAGMLALFRKAGHPGLLLVLDEVETIRHYRKDLGDKALELLRDFVDKIAADEFPGLLLLVTGTPPLFESERGLPALEPLHQRIKVSFGPDPSTDNLRQHQIRLKSFDPDRLKLVAGKVRDIYPADNPDRLKSKIDDKFTAHLLEHFKNAFGGQIGVSPRLFLRELIDILDRVDQHDHFDPYKHQALGKSQLTSIELSEEEESALQNFSV